jgi:crotonobetainyl-CoA:carnitine CoA-transferase CaiB-like acyl-CoA transferase
MVEAALNAAAEAIVEFGATGRVLERMGNRSPGAAPQGLFACAGSTPGREHWLAVSVETEAQRRALAEVLGASDLGGADTDAALARLAASQPREALLARLLAAGVPAAPVADPRAASLCPQHVARGFFEEVEHPVVGAQPVPTVPFRYASVPRWTRRPAPTLGQHSHEILSGLLGLAAGEIARLEADRILGTRPAT